MRTLLDARRGQIADRWHMALAPTSFVPYGWQEVRDRLVELVERVLDVLCAEPLDRQGAQAVGADLAQLHYRQPEALSVTQETLSAGVVAGLSPTQVAAIQPRLTALLGGIAAGFLRQVQAHTLEEQDAIRAALLTQRKRVEEALRASEERFRAVFAEAAIGIGLADLEGRIVEINRAWEEMLGYDSGEMVGVRITDVLHPDEVPSAWVMYGEMMAGKRRLYHAEQRHLRKDGQMVWCDLIVSIVHDAAGRPQFAVGMAEDITERKRSEAALAAHYRAAEAARSETRAILDATSEAMLLVAPEGRILTTNQRFAEFFTLQQDLLLGRPFDDVRPVFERIFGDPATVARLARQFADTERRGTEDVTQHWPEHRELELYSTPVSGAEAQTLGRLFAFRDVTREREVDRMKSEFVALVSHELRTPLTSIKGYVDLLLAGDVGELETEQREFLAIVGNNADRLAALIADLLDLARIESGRIELARTPLDLGRVLTDLGAAFRPQVERKGQRLAVDLAPGLPALWADPARVTQILTNLLSNAHKYTPSGGGITVVARPDGAMVRIEVRDTGIGMTAEELAQLFTRFFRAKNRATQEVSGTGLGLAITRSLVQLHGGRIDVASVPGRGSTFTVALPALASPAEAPALPSPPPRPGQRVLVVDDEPEIGLLLRRYLERAGYAVVEAHSADAALRLARREQPDLITMDIRMPDADGFTALEWLKGDPATARIPVLLISVLEDNGQGKLLGAVDHVAKPVAEAALLERVAAALAGANRRRVVLADADADARRPLAHLLRRQGYEVAEAADGAEAVALIRARRPDCALLDVRMPGTDGLAALAMLREDRTTRDLPVILLTASPGTSADVRPEAERLRVAGLVAKPSSAEELAAAMSAALGSGGRV